jgi:hypothetical protein
MWHNRRVNTTALPNRYTHDRLPTELLSHGVWLYYRFCLSSRDVEELRFARGMAMTYEAVRKRYVPRVMSTDQLKSYGGPCGSAWRAWRIANIAM